MNIKKQWNKAEDKFAKNNLAKNIEKKENECLQYETYF